MEREYIAFISYRHKPLDIEVARRIHRLIERYRIHRDLRKDHSKRLGYVFRDRDELPLSSDLSADIKSALDRSKFLIVICTPDTPKSPWVRLEIEYFLKNHDRKCVLAVLADGTPEESFPEQITHIYEEDGITLNRIVEPLAANVVSSVKFKRHFLIKAEFLRLVAAMLDCPYDMLRQREKRYRQQQISVAALAVAVTAIGFAVTVTGKNREIQAKNAEIEAQNIEIQERNAEIQAKNDEIQIRFEQAQRNESYALSLVSGQLLQEGDRDGAVVNALNALPSTSQERPVSVEAELALSNALYAYQDVELRADCRIEQETNIRSMLFSEGGRYILTMDDYGGLRCYNGYHAELLWEREDMGADGTLFLMESEHMLFYSYLGETMFLSLEDGVVLKEVVIENAKEAFVSDDGKTVAYLIRDDSNKGMSEYKICFYRLSAMELIAESPVLDIIEFILYENYCFSPDGARFALDFGYFHDENFQHVIYVFDVETGNLLCAARFEQESDFLISTNMIFLPEGDLLLYCEELQYEEPFQEIRYLDRIRPDAMEVVYHREINEEWHSSRTVKLLLNEERLSYIGDKDIVSFDLKTGELCQHIILPTRCIACEWLDGTFEKYTIFFEDGSVGVKWENDPDSSVEGIGVNIGFEPSLVYGSWTGKDYICGIPEKNKNYAVIYRYRGDEQKKEFQMPVAYANSKESSSELHFSPSGDKAVRIDFKLSDGIKAYTFVVYDVESMLETDRFEMMYEDTLSFKGFSRDENKLIFDRCVYDLKTGTCSDVPECFAGAKLTYYEMKCKQQVDAPTMLVFFQNSTQGKTGTISGSSPFLWKFRTLMQDKKGTIFWCEDGKELMQSTCPYEGNVVDNIRKREGQWIATGASGLIVAALDGRLLATKGYAVYSTEKDEWTYIENACQEYGYPIFCVGHVNPWVAFGDYDGVLRIADGSTGEIVKTFPLGMAADSVEEMQFLLDDTLLLIRHTDSLRILDLEDGTTKVSLRPNGLSESTELFVRADEGGNRLYIGDHNRKMEGVCVDLSTGKVCAVIPGLVCYAPDARLVFKWDTQSNSYVSYPAYTVPELVEKGEKLLAQ